VIVRTRGGVNRELRAANPYAQDFIPSPADFGVWSIGSGTGLTVDHIAGIPAVLNAIWLIAETVASVPLLVYRGVRAQKRSAETSWQWDRLHERPNDEQDPFTFWFDVTACIESRGNAFLQKVKFGGEVVALYVIDPDIIQVKRRRPDNAKVFVIGGRDGQVELTSSEVLHIRGPSLKGGDVGMSPLRIEALRAGVESTGMRRASTATTRASRTR
jgi:HK97 family phage portal protein